ncbi:MFS transporter [Mesorhizobium sp. L-8-10]|uniref:MFS transporter n=1 Tax=Mesorhizobium sp. L-8-10 TaxID=2744523 RepID=UPI001926CE59|nr:MFS transporter [Mesorhizobium sp. L-8-10]BCH28239.1 MFS transporter [Mesorhizobium sp. L-8-10]
MNRTKLILAVSIALSVLATTLMLPILAPLIRELHLSVSQGGLMLSIGSLAMVITAPLWGTVSDRYGRKAAIVSGFAGIFVGFALFTVAVQTGLSGSLTVTALFIALTASRAFVGTFLSAVPAGAQALMADITTARERSSGMAIIGAATGLGLIVGPAVSGLLVTHGIILPLFAATALCVLGAMVAAFLLKTEPAKPRAPAHNVSVFSAALQPWLFAGILLWVAVATTQISAGFYFQDRLGLDTGAAARMLSLALTLVGAAMFVVQLLQVGFLRFSPRILVLAGAGLWIAGLLLLLSMADALSYCLAYTLLGLGAGFLLPGVMAGASLAAGHDSQGVAAGLVSASQGIGFVIGPAVSTALYEWDKALPFWILAGLMLLLLLKFAIIPLRFPRLGDAES